jgi:hypothetical protein
VIANRSPSRIPRFLRKLAAPVFFLSAMGLAMTNSAAAQQAMGWLEIKPGTGPDIIQIDARALSITTIAGLGFTMNVVRRNAGNHSNSQQSGTVGLAGGEPKTLSTTAINVAQGDSIQIELKLFASGREISSNTFAVSGATP